jgi:cyclohexadienyl dehydratase
MSEEGKQMRRIVIGVIVGLSLATSAWAQQASRLDEIIKRGTLRVGMTGDYRPFTSLDKASENFSGFDVDMAESPGKALGVKVDYVQTAPTGSPRCQR